MEPSAQSWTKPTPADNIFLDLQQQFALGDTGGPLRGAVSDDRMDYGACLQYFFFDSAARLLEDVFIAILRAVVAGMEPHSFQERS